MKTHLVEAELLHADRRMDEQTDGLMDWQADMTKLIVAFRKFANAPKTTESLF
jgi:hypothetical protein